MKKYARIIIAIVMLTFVTAIVPSVKAAEVIYVNGIGDVKCIKGDDGKVNCYHNGVLLEDVTPKEPTFSEKVTNGMWNFAIWIFWKLT